MIRVFLLTLFNCVYDMNWVVICGLYLCVHLFTNNHLTFGGPGGVVGIAKSYGLDGSGIESRWVRDFLHLSRLALGPTQPPVQWVKSSWGMTLTPHPFLVL